MRRIVNGFKVAAPTQFMFSAQGRGLLVHHIGNLLVGWRAVIHVNLTLKHAAVDGYAKVMHA